MNDTQKHGKMAQSIENQLVTLLNNGKTNGKIESFEINDITSKWMDDNHKKVVIGFAYNTMMVWHWFTLTITNDDEFMSFRESYSRNTGKSKKGWTHGFNVSESINKKLNTNIF